MHGLALSWEIFIRKYTIKNSFFKLVAPAFSWTFTFCFIMVTFISMRADSLSSAAGIVSGIFTKMDLSKAILFITVQGMFSAMLLTAILLIFVPTVFKNKIKAIFLKTPLIGKIALFIIIVQIVVELENQNIVPFIYAQY
jgi:hypothetical protein